MAAKDEITTKFKVDISDLKRGIADANQQIKLANAQFKAATAGMDDWSKSADGIKAKLNQLDSILSAQKQRLQAYREQLQRQEEAYKTNGERANALKAKLQELADNGVSKTSAEYKKYEAQLAATEKEQESNKKSIDSLKVQLLNEEAAVAKTEKEYSNYEKALAEVSDEQKDTEKSTDDLNDELDESEKSAKKASDGFTVMKGVLSNLVSSGIKMAVKGLKDLGNAFVDTIQDVAIAGDEIQKNSQKVGLSYESYQKWDYAMKVAGTEMASMNTGLKTMTKQFDAAIHGGKSNIENFQRLGLAMSDIRDLSREELFGTIIEKLQGISNETEKAALASTFFGKSGQELLPLLNQSTEATQALLDEAEQYGLVLSDEAVEASAGFKDSLTLMTSAIGGVKKSIVSEFLPAATDMMQGFAGIIAGVDGADEQLQDGAENFIKRFTGIIPKVVTVLNNLVTAFLNVAPDIFNALIPALMGLLPSLIQTAGKIIPPLIQTVVSAILGALPELIQAVTQLAAALIQNLGTILPMIVDEVLRVLPLVTEALIDAVPTILLALFSMFEEIFRYLPTILPQVIQFVIDLVQQVGGMLIENAPIMIESWLSMWTALLEALPIILEQLADALPTIIDGILSFFADNFDMILDAAVGMFLAIVNAIPKILPPLLKALGKILSSLTTGLVTPAIKIFKSLWESIKKVFEKVKEWFSEKWEGAKKAVTDAFANVGQFFADKWQEVKDAFAKVGEYFSKIFGEAWQNIKDKFSQFGSFFSGLWDGVKKTFTSLGTKIGDAISGAVKSGINGVIRQIENIINSGIRLINGAIGLINKIPGVNISELSLLSLPRLQRGGVLEKGQVGLLEGTGAEAVVPLENNARWVRAVASEMAKQMSGVTTQNITNDYNFTQNIYAPQQPSRIELYRQTRNLLAYATGVK